MAGEAKKNGRPTKKTPEAIQKILDGLSDGIPLAVLCRENDELPHVSTIWDWEQDDKELSQSIARAREIGFDAIAYRTRDTARGRGESTADVQRDKLIIETDLKLLSKWSPRYREKSDIDMNLSGGFKIEKVKRVICDPKNSTD